MTPILSRESRKRKRRIANKTAKALRDLHAALTEMKDFAEDHESLWRHNEQDIVVVDCLKCELGELDLRPWQRAEHSVEGLLHLFNTLSEDK